MGCRREWEGKLRTFPLLGVTPVGERYFGGGGASEAPLETLLERNADFDVFVGAF